MQIGEWVHFGYNKSFVSGFITDTKVDTVRVKTVYYMDSISIVYRNDDVETSLSVCCVQSKCIHPDDLPILIDLSLQMNDKEWFNELMYELSLWRSPSEVMGKE